LSSGKRHCRRSEAVVWVRVCVRLLWVRTDWGKLIKIAICKLAFKLSRGSKVKVIPTG
jgi:hypothetical protein